MTTAADQFQRLEDKLSKIVETYRRIQAENRGLSEEIQRLKSESKQGAERYSALEREIEGLRRERDEVRVRIERLLAEVDALTKQDLAG